MKLKWNFFLENHFAYLFGINSLYFRMYIFMLIYVPGTVWLKDKFEI